MENDISYLCIFGLHQTKCSSQVATFDITHNNEYIVISYDVTKQHYNIWVSEAPEKKKMACKESDI